MALHLHRSNRTEAPHDWTDLSIADAYPRGPGSDVLEELMTASAAVFAGHLANVARTSGGQRAVVPGVW